jgi:hypothetical protein
MCCGEGVATYCGPGFSDGMSTHLVFSRLAVRYSGRFLRSLGSRSPFVSRSRVSQDERSRLVDTGGLRQAQASGSLLEYLPRLHLAGANN